MPLGLGYNFCNRLHGRVLSKIHAPGLLKLYLSHSKEVHICLSMAHRNVMKCVDYVDIDRNWFLMIMHDHAGTGTGEETYL